MSKMKIKFNYGNQHIVEVKELQKGPSVLNGHADILAEKTHQLAALTKTEHEAGLNEVLNKGKEIQSRGGDLISNGLTDISSKAKIQESNLSNTFDNLNLHGGINKGKEIQSKGREIISNGFTDISSRAKQQQTNLSKTFDNLNLHEAISKETSAQTKKLEKYEQYIPSTQSITHDLTEKKNKILNIVDVEEAEFKKNPEKIEAEVNKGKEAILNKVNESKEILAPTFKSGNQVGQYIKNQTIQSPQYQYSNIPEKELEDDSGCFSCMKRQPKAYTAPSRPK